MAKEDASGDLYDAALAVKARFGRLKTIAMLLKIAEEMMGEAALEQASLL